MSAGSRQSRHVRSSRCRLRGTAGRDRTDQWQGSRCRSDLRRHRPSRRSTGCQRCSAGTHRYAPPMSVRAYSRTAIGRMEDQAGDEATAADGDVVPAIGRAVGRRDAGRQQPCKQQAAGLQRCWRATGREDRIISGPRLIAQRQNLASASGKAFHVGRMFMTAGRRSLRADCSNAPDSGGVGRRWMAGPKCLCIGCSGEDGEPVRQRWPTLNAGDAGSDSGTVPRSGRKGSNAAPSLRRITLRNSGEVLRHSAGH